MKKSVKTTIIIVIALILLEFEVFHPKELMMMPTIHDVIGPKIVVFNPNDKYQRVRVITPNAIYDAPAICVRENGDEVMISPDYTWMDNTIIVIHDTFKVEPK